MSIELTLKDLTKDCAVGTGMAVYVWHCDRDGNYSLYSKDAAEQNYLRGVQVADEQGRVFFTSTFPACYDGRWPHIHFEVFDSLESAVAGDNARLTSQIALPEDTCKAVYAADKGYEEERAESVAGHAELRQRVRRRLGRRTRHGDRRSEHRDHCRADDRRRRQISQHTARGRAAQRRPAWSASEVTPSKPRRYSIRGPPFAIFAVTAQTISQRVQGSTLWY